MAKQPVSHGWQVEPGVVGLRNPAEPTVMSDAEESHRPRCVLVEEPIVKAVDEDWHVCRGEAKCVRHPKCQCAPLRKAGGRANTVARTLAPRRVDWPFVTRMGLCDVNDGKLAAKCSNLRL